ncbi:MAG: putative integron cassette protein [Herbaspirillum sp.]|jgi:quinol monooxygenase YgiN|nr:putative integron cassette protein [Herbaspirillum sp.]
MTKFALLAQMTAKPGKEADVEAFLKNALTLANQEAETPVWFALKLSPSRFGIFDAFAAESGREAHLSGAIAKALMARASELLTEPPTIEKVDILAAKVPG